MCERLETKRVVKRLAAITNFSLLGMRFTSHFMRLFQRFSLLRFCSFSVHHYFPSLKPTKLVCSLLFTWPVNCSGMGWDVCVLYCGPILSSCEPFYAFVFMCVFMDVTLIHTAKDTHFIFSVEENHIP